MAYTKTIHGGLTNTDGSCPGCGAEVDRVHAWNPGSTRDAYRCPSCGTFEYATGGAELPGDQPAAATETTFQILQRTPTLQTVLDPVDCVS